MKPGTLRSAPTSVSFISVRDNLVTKLSRGWDEKFPHLSDRLTSVRPTYTRTQTVEDSMKKLCIMIVLALAAAPCVFADSQDTVVFRTRMLPDNEVPPIGAPGNSAAATITVHVTRDEKANVNAATVTFDID